jgi:hypothetical protein
MPAVVMTASAPVKGKARQYGRYRVVRVVEINHWDLNAKGWNWRPTSIRCREVVRVYRDYGACSEGRTERCQYRVALADAERMCREINSAGDLATVEQIIGAGGSA